MSSYFGTFNLAGRDLKFYLSIVEDLNVITGLKCNKLLNVITFGLTCNKLLNVITFGLKCNNT